MRKNAHGSVFSFQDSKPKLQEQTENHKVVNHEGTWETYNDQGNVILIHRLVVKLNQKFLLQFFLILIFSHLM
mgnify:CR=1 FL=1